MSLPISFKLAKKYYQNHRKSDCTNFIQEYEYRLMDLVCHWLKYRNHFVLCVRICSHPPLEGRRSPEDLHCQCCSPPPHPTGHIWTVYRLTSCSNFTLWHTFTVYRWHSGRVFCCCSATHKMNVNIGRLTAAPGQPCIFFERGSRWTRWNGGSGNKVFWSSAISSMRNEANNEPENSFVAFNGGHLGANAAVEYERFAYG